MMNKNRYTEHQTGDFLEIVIYLFVFLIIFLGIMLWSTKHSLLKYPLKISEVTHDERKASYYTIEPIATESIKVYVEEVSTLVEEDIIEAKRIEELNNKYIYEITNDERELLLKLVFREANAESIECQIAILQVIFNRVASNDFKNTIYDVIYEEKQFKPVSNPNFEDTIYTDKNIEALEQVLKGVKIIPDDILFFWSLKVDVDTPGTWFYKMHRDNFYMQIDNTRFYY